MVVKVNCFITVSEEGKGAYGVRVDNAEKVYFPHGMSEYLKLEEFEEVEALLDANDHQQIPWRALRVRRLEEEKTA